MLSDRSYMRDSYGRTTTSTLTWMLCALSAGFLIQTVFERAFESSHFKDFAGLTVAGLQRGCVWTFASYPLLHSNVIHGILSLVAIYFLGRELLPLMGERRFALFSVFSAVCGGLVWLLVHHKIGGTLIGATPIACALLMLFACLHPNRPMTFLFLFLPVTVKPKHLAWAMAGISAVGLVVNEIPGDRFNLNITPSAHFGGMLAALLYYRFVHVREWRTPDGRADIELPRWLSKAQKTSPVEEPAKYTVNLTTPTRENLKAEVDRILDKINSEGFAALTAQEKRLLDDARNQISRR
ncbi:MAG: rhomboid family intramembrane serine protease [Nibricoccus sp.]